MALNLNAPENWAKWVKACLKDPGSPIDLAPGSLGMPTGQDCRALQAIAACWNLYGGSDADGQNAALAAARALLRGMQEKCWPIAREIIPQQLDWNDRFTLWPRVLARVATATVAWRGSVRDLATDLAALLTPEQRNDLVVALTVQMMAGDRGVDSAETRENCEPGCTLIGPHRFCALDTWMEPGK